MYGTTWCGDCARSKRLLERLGVPYTWHNIEQDKEAREYVVKVNRGNRSVPTIVFPDGSVLTEPSDAVLEQKVRASGLK
jgi:mycoredoxin